MSLRHAILGILDYAPMHGYQLKSVLELGISTFWPVNLAAIYPSLRQLDRDGLVSPREEASPEGRPHRKVYTITAAGRSELARWRRLPPEGPTRVRSPLYLKLLFAQEENVADTLAWIDGEIRTSSAAAAFLRAQLDNPQAFSTFFVNFMRESGVAHLELQIRRLEELRERIAKGLEKREQRDRLRDEETGGDG
jgi:DNA-binding PadR family transcriptional regulator